MGNRYFADISNNDGHVDMMEYAAAGHLAIAIKATEGTTFVDPFHRGWSLRAGLHHLSVWHYHFARPDLGNDPHAEADHFWEYTRFLAGPRDYLVLDLERAVPSGWVHDPAWSREFDERIRALSRFSIILYGSRSSLQLSADWLTGPPRRVWDADWSTDPDFAPAGYACVARQYTDGQFGPQPRFAAGIGICDMSRLSWPMYRNIITARQK